MNWNYILADTRPRAELMKNRDLSTYYSLSELVEQYNLKHKSQCVATKFDGYSWLTSRNHGQCYIKTLDGMCGVLLIYGFQGMPSSSIATMWHPLLQFLAEKGNYTKMMMSDLPGETLNEWKKLGYETISSFTNKRTPIV